jgi:hypothetical protein
MRQRPFELEPAARHVPRLGGIQQFDLRNPGTSSPFLATRFQGAPSLSSRHNTPAAIMRWACERVLVPGRVRNQTQELVNAHPAQ